MVPPAPATFSTTKLALPPMTLRMASPRSRATRSVGPPAAKGTISVMGLVPGKLCACALKLAAATRARVMIFFIDVSKERWAILGVGQSAMTSAFPYPGYFSRFLPHL